MSRKVPDTMIITTMELTAESHQRLEMFLIGKRGSRGRRMNKRMVFQYLLDRFLDDPRLQKKLIDDLTAKTPQEMDGNS